MAALLRTVSGSLRFSVINTPVSFGREIFKQDVIVGGDYLKVLRQHRNLYSRINNR